jgi:signal transduction histidine kinase
MQTHDTHEHDTILVVDDDPNLDQSLFRLLRLPGRWILMASNADEAFHLLKTHKVNLLISDYRMPGMNGTELIRKTSEMYPHVISILLTGHGDYSLAKELINTGLVYRYIEKPWNDEDLQSSVHEALEKFRLEEMNRKLTVSLASRNAELENLAAGMESSMLNLKNELDQTMQTSKINEQLAEVGMSTTQIAHDLRNPLTVLNTSLYLLRHHKDSTALDRNIDIMERAINQLSTMVEAIPVYVKQIAADKHLEDTDVDEFLSDVCNMMRPMTETKEISIIRDLQSAAVIPLDRAQMTSVIQNLIKNAFEAMNRGQITVGSRREQDFVEITVDDNGPGIPAELLNSLFKPFATFGKTKGTGLGLAGARTVVTGHGGTIVAENTGNGARFKIQLPC